MSPRQIMVSAGEVSGDLHGAYLIRELKKLRPDLEFFGLGSERLAAAGVDVVLDLTRRGTIGIFEALPNLWPVYLAFRRLVRLLDERRPDLLILIDSQGLNLPLAREAKKRGIKTVYYIAPQEWLWGTAKGTARVAATVDLIVAIFQKEYDVYKKAGANVVYFGHPLIDIVKPALSKEEARKKFLGREPEQVSGGQRPVIAICPGSRTQEIKGLLPLLLRAGKLIQAELPSARFLIPAATFETIKDSFSLVGNFHPQAVVGHTYDILHASDLALCASGTINLEASLLGVPSIMTYKLSWPTYFIGKYILRIDKKIKYFSMPNILLDENVLPELVMADAEPAKIARVALDILTNEARRQKMLASFAQLRLMLGGPGILPRVAKKILSMI
ncbi:MAG: lipid-A-disaccharide synthase [Candidatus Margulisiibacteriota bacterium]